MAQPSKIDVAVRATQRLERMLVEAYGAEGRGLHEKITSVEHRLSADLVKKMRWIATMRNKTVHEDVDVIRNIKDFERAVEESAGRLQKAIQGEGGDDGAGVGWIAVAVIAVVVAVYVVFGG